MIGYLAYGKEERRGALGERSILGVRFLQAVVPGRNRLAGRFWARRLASQLRRRGVTEAVYPRDCPYEEAFVRQGILPVNPLPLYRSMAPQVVRWEMGRQGISPAAATAAVVARGVGEDVRRILTELALQVRYVMLHASGGGDLCRSLQREYGVSVIRTPTRRQLAEAEILVLLCPPPEGLERKARVLLQLYDGERVLRGNAFRFGLPQGLEGEVEENCEKEQLLTVLHRAGALKNEQIPVMEVDIAGKTLYNASIVE